MTFTVDSYQYLDMATAKVVKAWVEREPAHDIPWTPLDKPLSECTVAFVSTAAISTRDQEPFDQAGERANPWWGDPSYRVLPGQLTEEDVAISHLHIDARPAKSDLDVVLPLRRLTELVEGGEVGAVAPRHVSIMGYILKPERLLAETAPAIVDIFREDKVDVVVLVPV